MDRESGGLVFEVASFHGAPPLPPPASSQEQQQQRWLGAALALVAVFQTKVIGRLTMQEHSRPSVLPFLFIFIFMFLFVYVCLFVNGSVCSVLPIFRPCFLLIFFFIIIINFKQLLSC